MDKKKTQLSTIYQFSPSLIGRQEEAHYSEQHISGYKDNPFIEALPPIFEEEEVALQIRKYPDYQDDQRKLGKQTRLHLVQQISDYVEPLPQHFLVEQRLSRLMRHAYKARNPFFPEYIRQFHIGFKDVLDGGVDQTGSNIAGVRSTAAAFTILGVSGQGKTTSIESSLLLYPQVIHHSTYKGQPFIRKQIVWLKLNCPFDGSVKGLCFNFLQAVDSILGTDYFQKFANKTKGTSVDMLIPIMAHIASLHGIGVLVIDEVQNLSSMKSGGAERVLNYFTQLINTIGVPVVLMGTFKAMSLLSTCFSQARRSTGQGDMILDRLVQGEEWNFFLKSLWKYQWTATKTTLNSNLSNKMYELSQGIIDIAVKLYMLSQWQAIEDGDGKERITLSLLEAVAKQHLQLVQPMLKLLKRNDPDILTKIDDLYPKWDIFDEYLKKSAEKVNVQGKIRTKALRDEKIERDEEKYIELIQTAIDFGVSSDIAQELSNKILQSNEADKDIATLRKQLVIEITSDAVTEESDNIYVAENGDQSRQKGAKKQKQVLDEDDLRNAVVGNEKDTEAMCEKLLDIGSIPREDELLKLII
ncbi:Tn7-like transposition protein C [Paenibacillus sp. FSL R7-269]|uniref:ATP-binding protein n=1 Tax=Paenibacillus sp. FSL R7-269 TaxID=1226755 RepID=UPI0003E22353|nr:ATP-binding protein [Paenibacillus sp. FSL R7-269]ETT47088.1 Tn7-like transposition protein C [Paenibacillus sp. FSL R7-269]